VLKRKSKRLQRNRTTKIESTAGKDQDIGSRNPDDRIIDVVRPDGKAGKMSFGAFKKIKHLGFKKK